MYESLNWLTLPLPVRGDKVKSIEWKLILQAPFAIIPFTLIALLYQPEMFTQALSRFTILPPTQVLSQLHSGQLLRVDARRGNAIIVCHRHHAEIAGPGAAIGGLLDIDCRRAIPIGQIALTHPESYEERRKAFLLRQRWIKSTQKVAENPVPLQRGELILRMLERYCGTDAIAQLPEDVIAQLVGVLPETIVTVRKILNSSPTAPVQPPQSLTPPKASVNAR